MLEMAKEKVLENAGFLCGVIWDKEDSMIGDLKYIDNFTLFNLREEWMMRMIIFDIVTKQNRWIDYTHQILSIKDDLSLKI